MALNIKNEETVALVRELAQRTGQSQTSVVEAAVRAELTRLAGDEQEAHAQRRFDNAMALLEEIDASLSDDDRQAIHSASVDLYGKDGLYA